MSSNIEVSVIFVAGDFVEVDVDVLVNAASIDKLHLPGVGGTAKAVRDILQQGDPAQYKVYENHYETQWLAYTNRVSKAEFVTDIIHDPNKSEYIFKTKHNPCFFIIQVGPPKYDKKNPQQTLSDLEKAYDNIFIELFNRKRSDITINSIVIPMLGTSSYGIPLETSARALFSSVHRLCTNFQHRKEKLFIFIPRYTKRATPFLIEFYYRKLLKIVADKITDVNEIFCFFNDKM